MTEKEQEEKKETLGTASANELLNSVVKATQIVGREKAKKLPVFILDYWEGRTLLHTVKDAWYVKPTEEMPLGFLAIVSDEVEEEEQGLPEGE